MRKEKSCGAVVYIKESNLLKFLLIKMNQGHWSFPKGHMEPGETELETALREIKEETNLDCFIDTDFREVITYSPYPNVIKDVVFFVGETFSPKLKVQTEELSQAAFFTEEEAFNLITFQTDKAIFELAVQYLKVHNKEVQL